MATLLRPAVEQQLRDADELSYVQFQLLARLGDAPDGRLRMTDLADGVVYSRSGLTYQAQVLEQRGPVTRGPSPDDDAAQLADVLGRISGHLRQHPPRSAGRGRRKGAASA
ncbi:MarR family transcriptional regulator [Curtobacterium sp. MCSS17_007]|uniref:MarR family transcriptional regulator n=1 Tax=Curtobacterium sp. MCSS17_007 TaxID=2175646 RepID=UPI0021AC37DF|nr:MarR family transcriptional regulator [Curtobacterium sp. MCSS17_007]WIE75829.1 MarR family transcriptional regulator [Curtobacterium sp. MCSS17_007]